MAPLRHVCGRRDWSDSDPVAEVGPNRLLNVAEIQARANRQGRIADHLARFDLVILDELGWGAFRDYAAWANGGMACSSSRISFESLGSNCIQEVGNRGMSVYVPVLSTISKTPRRCLPSCFSLMAKEGLRLAKGSLPMNGSSLK